MKMKAKRYDVPHWWLAWLLLLPFAAVAQVPVDSQGNPLEPVAGEYDEPATAPLLTAAELEELVGPVALYPDDLLAIVLPASTYPLEIVQAARFLEQRKADDTLEPDETWDESVTALLNYPEVIELLNEDIDWTWRLGEAVIAQQEQLIAAIESFRDRAYAAGNLKTDEHQTVSHEDGVIEIVPVDEEIIYVPYYEPEEVVVYQPRRVYYYYPRAYPVYYYPYPAGYRFVNGYFWGVTTAFTIGWHSDYLHVYHPTYWGHPYYGRYYYSHYYRRPSIQVYNTWYVNNSHRYARHRYRDGDYWRPRHRSGARPRDQRVRNVYYPGSTATVHNARPSRRDNVRSRNASRADLGLRERPQRTRNLRPSDEPARQVAGRRENHTESRRNRDERIMIDRANQNRTANRAQRRSGQPANVTRSTERRSEAAAQTQRRSTTVNRERPRPNLARPTERRSETAAQTQRRSTTVNRERPRPNVARRNEGNAQRAQVMRRAPERRSAPALPARPTVTQRTQSRPAAQARASRPAPAQRTQRGSATRAPKTEVNSTRSVRDRGERRRRN